MNQLTDLQIGYLAGAIDGEAYIELFPRNRSIANFPKMRSRGVSVGINIDQKDPSMLFWIQKVTGTGRIFQLKPKLERLGFKAQKEGNWRWHCNGKETEDILNVVKLYLITKAYHCSLVLQYFELLKHRSSRRSKIYTAEDGEELDRIFSSYPRPRPRGEVVYAAA